MTQLDIKRVTNTNFLLDNVEKYVVNVDGISYNITVGTTQEQLLVVEINGKQYIVNE
jgi:hypothetical protein